MTVSPNTHLGISPELVGEILSLEPGKARVSLLSRPEMVADDQGLVHGGFAFGLADYAAMLVVNHPNVVLAKAETKFLAPVKLGQTMVAEAELIEQDGRKSRVRCVVSTDTPVFDGVFTCIVLDKHVLAND